MANVPGKSFNFPGWQMAYGAPFLPAETVATGGKIFWVGNRSDLPAGNGSTPGSPLSTMAVAFGKCVSGRGDVIYVLPGHAENIATATAWSATLKAGTKIIGLGTANERPVFTFSATGSQALFAVANVLVKNCRFLAAGPAGTTAITVTAPFSVTASGCQFVGNDIQVGVDADQLCTDCFTVATATDVLFQNNYFWSGAAAAITTVIKTTGACDRLKILNNWITAEIVTAATGVCLDLSNAAILDNIIVGNLIANNTASSKFVIKPHASSTGFVDSNKYFTGDGATAPAVSAWSTYTTNYKFGINQCVTAVSVSALLSPAVDA